MARTKLVISFSFDFWMLKYWCWRNSSNLQLANARSQRTLKKHLPTRGSSYCTNVRNFCLLSQCFKFCFLWNANSQYLILFLSNLENVFCQRTHVCLHVEFIIEIVDASRRNEEAENLLRLKTQKFCVSLFSSIRIVNHIIIVLAHRKTALTKN